MFVLKFEDYSLFEIFVEIVFCCIIIPNTLCQLFSVKRNVLRQVSGFDALA